MTYVPILIVGFSFWCVWAMVMFPPVCLKWNQKFLFLYFLTSWLQIPKQTEPQFLWDCFLFSIIWASYKKKILNLNYILGCPKEVSKWVITYNLLINGVFLGVITHWSDHLWSWLPTGHPSKGARWNWGRENSLTKTPVESMEKPPSSRTVDHPIIDPRPTLRTGQHMPLRILPNWCQDGMNMAPNH